MEKIVNIFKAIWKHPVGKQVITFGMNHMFKWITKKLEKKPKKKNK